VNNTDRLIAYLRRVAPYRAADPDGYEFRYRAGCRFQAALRTPKAANVTPIRRKYA
jgi:hypothetical protein